MKKIIVAAVLLLSMLIVACNDDIITAPKPEPKSVNLLDLVITRTNSAGIVLSKDSRDWAGKGIVGQHSADALSGINANEFALAPAYPNPLNMNRDKALRIPINMSVGTAIFGLFDQEGNAIKHFDGMKSGILEWDLTRVRIPVKTATHSG